MDDGPGLVLKRLQDTVAVLALTYVNDDMSVSANPSPTSPALCI